MTPTSSAHEHQLHDRAPTPRPDRGPAATHEHPAPTGVPAHVEGGAHERHSVEMFRDRCCGEACFRAVTVFGGGHMNTIGALSLNLGYRF